MESQTFSHGRSRQNGSDHLNLSSYLTFTLIVTITFKVSRNWFKVVTKKRVNNTKEGDWNNLPGVEVIPGLPSWDPTGVMGNIPDVLPIEKTFHIALKLSEKYGDIIKASGLNQRWVVLNSGPLVQTLCKSSDMGHLTKSSMVYDLTKPFITNGLGASHGKLWQHQRKILIRSQSYQSLRSFMPMLNKHCKTFVSSLDTMFSDGKPHQINELINSSFIKVICEMITGFENGQSNESERYHHNFQTWKRCMVYQLSHPWFLFSPLWKLHPMSKEHVRVMEEMSDFARDRIREHKQKRAELEQSIQEQDQNQCNTPNGKEFRSVLDDLVEAGVEEGQTVDEINSMIFGGHETGSTVIHFFCLCMALNPGIQEDCQNEVDELFEDPLNYKDGAFTYEILSSRLKLVERCILETLRLFPPAFFFSRRLETPLKINYNGECVALPPGTNAVICPFLLHRKPEYFPEPDKFNSDHFLPEVCAKRHPCAFVPFSVGPRNCIGMKFAMIEMKTVAAYILRHFFITTNERMEDVSLLPLVTTTPARDFTFQFTKREKSFQPS